MAGKKSQQLERPLPTNVDAERLVLGGIMIDNREFEKVSAILNREDFSLDKHRRVWTSIGDLMESGSRVDRITLADHLNGRGELQAVDGFAYICSLDEGLPPAFNLSAYARIVKDKAALRRTIYLAQTLMERSMDGADDAATLLGEFEAKIAEQKQGLEAGEKRLATATDTIRSHPGGISGFLSPHLHSGLVPSGYQKLNEYLYGFGNGRIITLAADTSVGKTTFALNLVYDLTASGIPAGYISLEMERTALVQKLVCLDARVSYHRFMRGNISPEERSTLGRSTGRVAELPLYIDDSSDLDMRGLYTGVQRMLRDHGTRIVVLDYLQIMDLDQSGYGRTFKSEYEALTYLSNGIRKMVKRLNSDGFQFDLILLSQFNKDFTKRDKGDKRPKLTDLHGSGSIRKDSHIVAFLFREELLYPNRPELRGVTELIIRKNRFGPIGTVRFRFDAASGLFIEDEDQSTPAPAGQTRLTIPSDAEIEAAEESKGGSLWDK